MYCSFFVLLPIKALLTKTIYFSAKKSPFEFKEKTDVGRNAYNISVVGKQVFMITNIF